MDAVILTFAREAHVRLEQFPSSLWIPPPKSLSLTLKQEELGFEICNLDENFDR